jgi:hypothetical protein
MPNGHTQERIENFAGSPVSFNPCAQHLKLLEQIFSVKENRQPHFRGKQIWRNTILRIVHAYVRAFDFASILS